MSHACPSCKDENTQRLSLVYESGLSDVNTHSRGVGVGIGGGGIGVGVGGARHEALHKPNFPKKPRPLTKNLIGGL